MTRWRIGDRVTLRYCPGRWRIAHIDQHTIWLQGQDSFAEILASLSPCARIGVSSKDLVVTQTQETLL